MLTVGLCMVRNADDVIGPVLSNALYHCDRVVVVNNLSTDRTAEVLMDMSEDDNHIYLNRDDDPAYNQSDKMTLWAGQIADAWGQVRIVPFDADEIWYVPGGGRIADVLADDVRVARAELFDHVVTGVDDPDDPNPVTRIQWRRVNPGLDQFHKASMVTNAGLRINAGNHGCSYGGVAATGPVLLGIRHFPYRSVPQMIAKARIGAAAMRATTQPYSTCQHWRDYDQMTDQQIGSTFTENFYAADPSGRPDLVQDPAPWMSGS